MEDDKKQIISREIDRFRLTHKVSLFFNSLHVLLKTDFPRRTEILKLSALLLGATFLCVSEFTVYSLIISIELGVHIHVNESGIKNLRDFATDRLGSFFPGLKANKSLADELEH